MPDRAERLGRILDAVAAPRVEIGMYGGERADRLRTYYVARHPRYRVIRRKTLGVALLEVPPSLEDYLAGPARRELRSKRRRAARGGYRFVGVRAIEHLDAVIEINRSVPVRQEAPIPRWMTDERLVRRQFGDLPKMWAVVDASGTMRAYCDAPVLGEVTVLARILGHAEHLRHGIMDLLISGVVEECAAVRARSGEPRWIEYGTLWSCTAGMADFKRRLGFRPYRVRWTGTR